MDQVFISSQAQHENIGDLLIRRRLLQDARTLGHLNLLTADAPDSWKSALGLIAVDNLYRTRYRWMLCALTQRRGRTVLIYSPGEFPLDRRRLGTEIVNLLFTMAVRLRGGTVLRISRSVTKLQQPTVRVHQMAVRMSNITEWRDAASQAAVGVGELVPDIAYREELEPREGEPRTRLTVSLRDDAGVVSARLLAAVKRAALRHQLELAVCVQVKRDSRLARVIAEQLDVQLVDWEGQSHEEQYRRLLALYRRSHVVVSDRLHVLVLAALSGAVPVCLGPRGYRKIFENLRTVGLEHNCISDIAAHSDLELDQAIDSLLGAELRVTDAVRYARRQIEHSEFSRLRAQTEAR